MTKKTDYQKFKAENPEMLAQAESDLEREERGLTESVLNRKEYDRDKALAELVRAWDHLYEWLRVNEHGGHFIDREYQKRVHAVIVARERLREVDL